MKISLPFFKKKYSEININGALTKAEFSKKRKIANIFTLAILAVLLLIGLQIKSLASQYKRLYSYEMNDGLNRHAYSKDAYDIFLRLRKLQVTTLEFSLHLVPINTLKNEREMTIGMISNYKEEGSDLHEKGKKFESLKIAIDSVNRYIDATEDLDRGQISPSELSQISESTIMDWMIFTQDCINDESSIRDRMLEEVLAFKPLAEESLFTLLIYFSIFLFMVWVTISISWKLLKSQRKSYERVDLLISSIGHDLRSPLQVIENSVSLMGNSTTAPDRLRHAKVIKDSANTVACLVDDILTVVRHQKPQVRLGKVSLKDWVSDFEAIYKPKVIAKGLTWVKDFNETQSTDVTIDSDRLRQCIGNLVDNSIRYTENGRVGIKITLIPIDEKEIQTLSITVSDSGMGIAEKDKLRIFKPFERTERSRGIKGMGLGLSIVENIVDSFSGKIYVESEVGKGSKFTVKFPVFTGASFSHDEKPIELEKNIEHYDVKNKSDKFGEILVIDDTKEILDSVASLLRDISFNVDTAPSGIIALQMLEKASYKIVLTDLQMPGVDGVGVAKRIREKSLNTQVIVMTADSAALNATGDDKEFDFFLPKPFQALELLGVIEKAEKKFKEGK